MTNITKIVVDNTANIDRTHRGDRVKATKAELIELFGGYPIEYEKGEADKVTNEWRLLVTFNHFGDVTTEVMTVYDWKEETPPTLFEEIEWTIGAENRLSSIELYLWIKEQRKKQ